jgi:uncharacterized protein (TIGR02145 family)
LDTYNVNIHFKEGFMSFIKRQGRALLVLAAVVAVGLAGCEDNGAGGGGGGALSCGNRECASAAMPDGKTWMTENLNVETADSWCYGNSSDSCAKYGRLYTWEAAKRACQSVGMRLPTKAEWDALVTAAGGSSTAGKKLKSTSGGNSDGNGTNDFGFSALPGGYRGSLGSFDFAGGYGYWWTATEHSDGNAYNWVMYSRHDDVDEYFSVLSYAISVRCVQDN